MRTPWGNEQPVYWSFSVAFVKPGEEASSWAATRSQNEQEAIECARAFMEILYPGEGYTARGVRKSYWRRKFQGHYEEITQQAYEEAEQRKDHSAGCPTDLRLLGEALKEWLTENRHYLPEGALAWASGGCWALAKALRDWIGDDATLVALMSPEGLSCGHALVEVGGHYLDGDGAHTREQVLDLWPLCVGQELRPLSPAEEDHWPTLCPDRVVRRLAEALANRFGPGSRLGRPGEVPEHEVSK